MGLPNKRVDPHPKKIWGCSSVGRAPALQAGGQEFESLRLHCENYKIFTLKYFSFYKKCEIKYFLNFHTSLESSLKTEYRENENI